MEEAKELIEANLEITENGAYNNIEPKEKFERANGKIVIKDNKPVIKNVGIPDGQFIIVEKKTAEAYEIKQKNPDWKPSYSVRAMYKDTEVSFFINGAEAKEWDAIGGIGDNIRVRMNKEEKINTQNGMTYVLQTLSFDLVE